VTRSRVNPFGIDLSPDLKYSHHGEVFSFRQQLAAVAAHSQLHASHFPVHVLDLHSRSQIHHFVFITGIFLAFYFVFQFKSIHNKV
jgi:uncharacterized membrane protein